MEFRFDSENGVIREEATGERCLIFPKARMEQIFSRLTELFQSGAQVIIIEACKAAGKWYVNELPEKIKADKTLFVKTAIQRLTEAGVGRIEIVEFKPEKATLKFRIWNNFFAEMRNDETTYCNVVEAYVSGVYQELLLKSPKIVKTACIDKGDAYCEWYMTPSSSGVK
jgi:predicted hydrocarbon binding protein